MFTEGQGYFGDFGAGCVAVRSLHSRLEKRKVAKRGIFCTKAMGIGLPSVNLVSVAEGEILTPQLLTLRM